MDVRKPYAICTCGFVDVRKPYAICACVFVDVRKPYATCTCGFIDTSGNNYRALLVTTNGQLLVTTQERLLVTIKGPLATTEGRRLLVTTKRPMSALAQSCLYPRHRAGHSGCTYGSLFSVLFWTFAKSFNNY